jgi:hypothetical protein
MNSARLERLLLDISALCTRVGETRTAESMDRLAHAVRAASSQSEYQRAVREVLQLFGGMGSFQDLVLQTREGVLPGQKDLDGLRAKLFQEARRELR